MKKYKILNKCRICKSSRLVNVLKLGNFFISSWLISSKQKKIIKSPLELLKCSNCNLIQLKHTVVKNYLYSSDYGYRSGTNKTMTQHLKGIKNDIVKRIKLKDNDFVLDIGCNDGTLLNYYSKKINKVGMDPIAKYIIKKKIPNCLYLNDYFNSNSYNKNVSIKPKVISSISMFYDLDDPMKFVKEIKNVLDDNGLWVLEQSYLPTMIENNSFDTICHEHLEYYGLEQIKYLAEKNNLKIIDASKNSANGGSIRIFLSHKKSKFKINNNSLSKLFEKERNLKLDRISTYKKFFNKISVIREKTYKFISNEIKNGKKIFVYGASTKGNTILQFYKLNSNHIKFAAERNPNKYNKIIPGTGIKIISEKESRNMKPNYFFVLPWHFKKEIISREKKFLNNNGALIFPLPNLKIVKK